MPDGDATGRTSYGVDGLDGDGERVFDVEVALADPETGALEIRRDGELARSQAAVDDNLALLDYARADLEAASIDVPFNIDAGDPCYWEKLGVLSANAWLISATLAVTPACAAIPFTATACAIATANYVAAAAASAIASYALARCQAENIPSPPGVG